MAKEILVDCPESTSPLLITPEKERQIKDALNVINNISSAVGDELDVESVESHADIHHQPGVFLLRKPEYSSMVKDVHFDFRRNLLSGSADSAHAVLQGNIVVERHDLRERSTHTVAIKNYSKRTPEDNFHRGLTEIRVMDDMAARGEVSYVPIGLVVAPVDESTNGEIAIITKHDSSILTMDNNPWMAGFTQENIGNALEASRAVGRFNSLGYIHNDAKIKNVAQNEYGKTGLIDFESARDIDVDRPIEVAEAALVDFSTFLDSLHKKGFFKLARRKENAMNELLDDLSASYLEAWAEAPLDVQNAAMEQVTIAVEQYMEQHQEISAGHK